ncbi:YbaB/EbfC family nucleoid-associated protein [Kribbella sp. NPDC056951]|uniref:YbaB/EbfC family nucleoid-associated protein n=1 Tax=Kribbella sp. NPDC056951 TaxID=3345978 RepID=UPI00362A174D
MSVEESQHSRVERTGAEARLGQLEDLERETRRVQNSVAGTTGFGESSDGLIEATVGVYGELAELVIDPLIYRFPDAEALAEEIRGAVNRAREEAQQKVRMELADYLPPHLSAEPMDPADLAFGPLLGLLRPDRNGGRR